MTKTKLTFLGAAGTVTGSKTLLESDGKKILIDCGLFQGLKNLREQNWSPFIIDPQSIDIILLTHAHLDHCGYIPLLVKKGFKGEIHCTNATFDLTEIILMDSAKIQEEDADRANRYHYSKHAVAEPLYDRQDVHQALDLFVCHEFNEWIQISENINFEFLSNGHILGSGFINMQVFHKKIVFSGDMGRMKPLLLYPPKKIEECDYLVMESTYGDRLHEIIDVKNTLRDIIHDTYEKRGILMIPSFAVERTQEILYLIYKLRQEDDLPHIPVYLDSPMGINSTKVYEKYKDLQNISMHDLDRMYDGVKFISDPNESKAVCLDDSPKIVLAGSGMIEGGRILHYLNNHLDNRRNTLLFVGYQAEGTRGRAILEGSKEIKFFGQFHKVECEIKSISSLSAHADRNDILTWLHNFKKMPETIFLNHGEPHQRDALRVKLETEFGVNCEVPDMYSEYELF